MLRSRQLIEGGNFIDGSKGEYIGTFWNGDHFIACFDSKREGSLDQFHLHVVQFDSREDYPEDYSIECFGIIHGRTYAVLMDVTEVS